MLTLATVVSSHLLLKQFFYTNGIKLIAKETGSWQEVAQERIDSHKYGTDDYTRELT